MKVFLKASSIGASVGENLSLTSDSGPVTPNSITKNQLLVGVAVLVEETATTLTVSSSGSHCVNSITLPILCGDVEFPDDVAVTPTSPPTATPTPTPTATPTPTPTATSTPVPTATSTPVPTATSTPVPTATSTPVPTATSTPVPTATSTPVPTATPTPTPTDTPMPTPTDTPKPPPTATPMPTPTDTPLPTLPPLPTPSVTFDDGVCGLFLHFMTYIVPDRLLVEVDGGIILDTGYISTGNQFQIFGPFIFDPASYVSATVDAPLGGTAWQLQWVLSNACDGLPTDTAYVRRRSGGSGGGQGWHVFGINQQINPCGF